MTKELFNAVKKRPLISVISKLEDELGLVVTKKGEVEQFCVQFYSKQLTTKIITLEVVTYQAERIVESKPRFTSDMQQELA